MRIRNDIDKVIGHLFGQFFIAHHFLGLRIKPEMGMEIPWAESVMGNSMIEKRLDHPLFWHFVFHL